jgi:tetratricopeptide (TPR) repeat protein
MVPRAPGRIAAVILGVLLTTSATALTALPAANAAEAPPAIQPVPQHQHYTATRDAAKPSASGALAPLLNGLGSHTLPVTTRSPRAQLFVNQGLNLTFAFNHAEAGRAFREAVRLDPACAMCYWGQALVLGPNINAPMAPETEADAHRLAQQAMALSGKATPREQAYIKALTMRYTGNPDDRAAADRAYADAMREIALRFPNDLDAAVLWAEAKMNLRPWDYWMPDGTPHAGTRDIVAMLESVMARNPDHPQALHLYIHVLESTATPEKAEPAADRLAHLMPGAGHMIHMPAHIYQRVGRYADAAAANVRAIAADERYIAQCRAQGLYPMGYYPHNIHFLWFAASAQGRGAVAIDAARQVASKIPDAALAEMPMLGAFRAVPYYALTRFGKWDAMLAEPAPPATDRFLTGIWHYGRGVALIAKGNLDGAEAELQQVRAIAADPRLDYAMFSPNTAAAIFAIAPAVLGGELAAARGDYGTAIDSLAQAVRLEDSLIYTEPNEWHYPARLALGAVLLDADRAREAEAVYWEDLRANPHNGWALHGLHGALLAQGKREQAAIIDNRFKMAWADADVALDASRIMPRPATRKVASALD